MNARVSARATKQHHDDDVAKPVLRGRGVRTWWPRWASGDDEGAVTMRGTLGSEPQPGAEDDAWVTALESVVGRPELPPPFAWAGGPPQGEARNALKWPLVAEPALRTVDDIGHIAMFLNARVADRRTGEWVRRKNTRRRDAVMGDRCYVALRGWSHWPTPEKELPDPEWQLYTDALPTIERRAKRRLGIYGRRIGKECAIDVASRACIEAMRKWDGERSFEALAWGIAKNLIGDLAYRHGLRSKKCKKQ